ncbi:acyl-CoA dehydrogenase family protein [Nonomuraea lactucae]|uniref:acyl-CoA dehydrogenase family protein n=1 Tax=Nonomuraea lactucae TaxID=2249762 RepID=UPI000DE212E9|nr:acyl-CoA dehydrogenase family protein [Nonomuraea lactucae]
MVADHKKIDIAHPDTLGAVSMNTVLFEGCAAESEDVLLRRAREAVPTLAANAAQTERDLRPTDESMAAVRQAGLLALTVPQDAGGLDVDLRTLVRVTAELGQGCASTAWVTSLSAAAKKLVSRFASEEGRGAVFADPDVVVCASALPSGSTGRRVSGGLRISGRWRMASGSEVATWASMMVPVPGDEQLVRVCSAVVPTTDLTVERTWLAAGLSGTSSHTLVADDVFVPAAHVTFPPTPATDDAPRLAPPPHLTFTAVLATLAPMLGAARGAQNVVQAALDGGRAPYATTYKRLADSPLGRYWFTEAVQLIDTATRRALNVADVLDALGPDDVSLPVQERARLRMELASAARECRHAVEKLLDLHGASGFTQDNPLQRFWRDLAVGTRHPHYASYIVAEDYGRLMFGTEPPVLLNL